MQLKYLCSDLDNNIDNDDVTATIPKDIISMMERILVGAPEDEPYHISGVRRPGAVYRCQPGYRGYPSEDSANPLQMCSLMEFDKNRSK
ncbi:unnamed protein product [Euphydryas editha]|uniref:Uncharacterized protein n=1 Tax=Euphydryas editha TaxID=104508 RepID=A0AAU9TEI7_EUPED|nr:unnamed protein product [Euphydryas editha]